MAFKQYISDNVFKTTPVTPVQQIARQPDVLQAPSSLPAQPKPDTPLATPTPNVDGSPRAIVDTDATPEGAKDTIHNVRHKLNNQAINNPSPSIQDRVKAGEDPYLLLLESQYKDSAQDAERSRKKALLGNLAQLFGQAVAAGMGARRFSQINTDVPYYTRRLEQLRQQYNAGKINYNLLMAKAERDRQIAMQQLAAKAAYDRGNMLYKAGLNDKTDAAKTARDLEAYGIKSGIDTEKETRLQGIKHNNNLAEIKARNSGILGAARIRNESRNRTIAIGDYDIAENNWNKQNIAYIFNKLPSEIRNKYKGEPIYRDNGSGLDGTKKWELIGNKPLTENDMINAITENFDRPEIQSAMNNIGARKSNRSTESFWDGNESTDNNADAKTKEEKHVLSPWFKVK